MTPDASRLPSEKEWGHSVCLVVHDPNTYTACDRCREAGAAIAATVRALVRAALVRHHAEHVPPCTVETCACAPLTDDPTCTCGLAALLADEAAPRG